MNSPTRTLLGPQAKLAGTLAGTNDLDGKTVGSATGTASVSQWVPTGGTLRLCLVGAGLGAGVTLIESVCTGQIYVPTLAFLVKAGRFAALPYLLLYNLMFCAPLLLALVIAYRGTTSDRFLLFARRHVLGAKLAMAASFLTLAALLGWLAA